MAHLLKIRKNKKRQENDDYEGYDDTDPFMDGGRFAKGDHGEKAHAHCKMLRSKVKNQASLKKGSKAAKNHMAMLRAMRTEKKLKSIHPDWETHDWGSGLFPAS